MADPLYTDAAQAAVELLTQLGQPVEVLRDVVGEDVGEGSYDPQTGTVIDTESEDAVHDGFGVHLEYDERDIDGTNILHGDQRVLIAPNLAITPRRGDRVDFEDGTILFVERSKPLAPAGVILLHEVQARGVKP